MRNLRFPALAVIVAVALTGCVKIQSNTGFSSDNLITQDLILAVNPAILSQFGVDAGDISADALLAQVPPGAKDRVEIEEYKDGDLEGVLIHAENLTLEEFNATTSVISDAAGGEIPEGVGGEMGLEALQGISGVLGGIAGATAQREGDEFVVTIPAGPGESNAAPSFGVNPAQLAQAIDFAAVFTFPGPVTEASRGEVEGKSVTLDIEDLQAGGEIVIRAGAEDAIAWGPILQWGLIILAGLVIVVGATAFVLADRARRKQNNLPEPVASADAWETPAIEPTEAPEGTAEK